jgi:hypothetical protein
MAALRVTKVKIAMAGWLAVSLGAAPSAAKLTFDQRVEIMRGLMAEFATVKAPLPRSKKPLEVTTTGGYDKGKWGEAMQQNGPAARVGDLIQITKVTIENDRIVLEINNGMKGHRHWYQNVQMESSVGVSPVGTNQSNAPSGTTVAVVFDSEVPAERADDIKKMLKPILDFEKRTATENYVDTLPKETQDAIKAKKVLVGMDRDMVLLARGRPDHKLRQSDNGVETEDWIYGKAPGKITFVTFQGNKVIRVKEDYAAPE